MKKEYIKKPGQVPNKTAIYPTAREAKKKSDCKPFKKHEQSY